MSNKNCVVPSSLILDVHWWSHLYSLDSPLQNHKSFAEIPAVQSLASSITIPLCVSIIYHLPIGVSEIVAIILTHVKIASQRRFKIAAKAFQDFQTFLLCVICCELDAGSAINTFFTDQSLLLCAVLIGKLYFLLYPVFDQKRPRSREARSRSVAARTSANLMRSIFEWFHKAIALLSGTSYQRIGFEISELLAAPQPKRLDPMNHEKSRMVFLIHMKADLPPPSIM